MPPPAQQLASYPNHARMIQTPVQRTGPPLRLVNETWSARRHPSDAPLQAADPDAFLVRARSW